jgi:DNA modification methylase
MKDTKTKTKKTEIVYLPIESVRPYSRNAKVHSKKQIKQVAESIQRLGFNQPLVVDKAGVIIVGHGRYEAAKQLELKEVPAIVVNLTEEEAATYRLGDNRLNESPWEMDLVIQELKTLSLPMLVLTGFDADLIIEPDAKDDIIPENVPARSKLGDLYELGSHRVLAGDSTQQEAVLRLMDGKKADMVFTDPPYGVNYSKKNEFLNLQDKGNRIQEDIENDTMTLGETSDFIYKLFCQIKNVLAERSSYYITAPQGGDLMMMMMMMMQKAGIPLRHCLIWVKNNHVLGRTDYNYKHEPILYGWVNVHDFYGSGEHRFSTWEIDKPTKNDLHPTMKPIALIVNAILNSTLKDMIVSDLCLGSGSTLIACEKTGRICYGMELDTKYVDVIVQRYVDYVPDAVVKCNGKVIEWKKS